MVLVTGPMAAYCGGYIRVTLEAEYAEATSVVLAEDFVQHRGRPVDPGYVSDAEAEEIGAAACESVRRVLSDLPPDSRPLRVTLVEHRYHPVDSGPFQVGAAAVRALRAALAELEAGASGSTPPTVAVTAKAADQVALRAAT